MSREYIHQALTALGYYAPYNDRSLYVAKKVSDDDPSVIEIEDVFCRIYFDIEQVTIVCGWSPTPDLKYFESEEQIIDFVKSNYPL